MPSRGFTSNCQNLVGHEVSDGTFSVVFEAVLGVGAYGVVYKARNLTAYGPEFFGACLRRASTLLVPPPPCDRPRPSVRSDRSLIPLARSRRRSLAPAVKCLNNTSLDPRQRHFQRRELSLHRLAASHPNIVSIHRIIESPSIIYVVRITCSPSLRSEATSG